MSFFGGGTDYPAFYLKEGGEVVSATIDKYCYITCRALPPFFGIRHKIVWSHIEAVSSTSEILHPAVREGLKYLQFDDSVGLEIHHHGDLPARAGMGSSSAFAVGLIHVLSAFRGERLSKQDLALKAIDLEQNCLKENVGSQDQVASAYGGLNHIRFDRDGSFKVEAVGISDEKLRELESRLMLFYTGTNRFASQIASKVIASIDEKTELFRAMKAKVGEALSVLRSSAPLDRFGELMHDAWQIKRQTAANISNAQIDRIYEMARGAGALGGKLLGAGGTGFVLFYVPQDKQASVRDALIHYLRVPFRFEREGSTIVYDGANLS